MARQGNLIAGSPGRKIPYIYQTSIISMPSQHGSIVNEVDSFGLSFRIILEGSFRSSVISVISDICSQLLALHSYITK
jgi:hypothetical protein